MGSAGFEPGGARGGALASDRPGTRDREVFRRPVGGTFGGSAAAPPRLPAAVGAAAPPSQGPRGPGDIQKNFAELVAACLPHRARDKPIEIWWQDEARVGQQGTLTRVWAARGSRPPAPRDQRYDWTYLFGAVCPARGTGAGLVLPDANKETMTLHLAEISRHVAPGAHAVVVLDNAGWHKPGGRLCTPDNISLLPLPPYSPELNPVETVWQFLRQNQLSNRVFDSYDAIVDACCDSWNALTKSPEKITSITTRAWASVTC